MDTFLNATKYRARVYMLYSEYWSTYNRKPYQTALLLFKDCPNIHRQLSMKISFFQIRKIVYRELRELNCQQRKLHARYMNETRFNVFSDAVYKSTNVEVLDLKESVIKYL